MSWICLLQGQLDKADHPDIQLGNNDSGKKSLRITEFTLRTVLSSKPVDHSSRGVLATVSRWTVLLVAARQCPGAGSGAVVVVNLVTFTVTSTDPLIVDLIKRPSVAGVVLKKLLFIN